LKVHIKFHQLSILPYDNENAKNSRKNKKPWTGMHVAPVHGKAYGIATIGVELG